MHPEQATNPEERSGTETLPEPASYFPIFRDSYDVSPGLHPFGTGFGNGDADGRVFQLDRDFRRYRAGKLAARSEDLEKYYRIHRYAVAENEVIVRFFIRHLTLDYPELFLWELHPRGGTLQCRLTGERLRFDEDMQRVDGGSATPPYRSALDALASQIQEDIAVISARTDGEHWVSALHACLPNYWSPADKIGRTFAEVHAPVPGMDRSRARSRELVDAMIRRGPYVRFTWGLPTDMRLNHHPEPPPGTDPAHWHGRHFDSGAPELYLRAEREVIWGFPEVGTALFTVRTCFTSCDAIRRDTRRRDRLVAALQSMTPEQAAYKGVAASRDEIVRWLTAP